MEAKQQQTPEKSISERISELMTRMSKDQLRFVVALQEYPSKKEAAESIGLRPDTVYRWNGEVEELANLLALDALESAKAIRRKALHKAVMVKIAGLDSNDESTRQKVASEIIEWELGKALQRQDVTSGGDKLKIEVEYVNDPFAAPRVSSGADEN